VVYCLPLGFAPVNRLPHKPVFKNTRQHTSIHKNKIKRDGYDFDMNACQLQ